MEQVNLSDQDVFLWRTFWRMGERAASCVDRALFKASGLSAADYGILSRLVEANADGELRQIELQASLGWDKSRLSHHLTRMAQRDLIARTNSGHNITLVRITPLGRTKQMMMTPAYHQAISDYFLSHLSDEERTVLMSVVQKLKATVEQSEGK